MYVPASKDGLETDVVLVIVEIIALGYVYIIIIYDLRQYHVTQLCIVTLIFYGCKIMSYIRVTPSIT